MNTKTMKLSALRSLRINAVAICNSRGLSIRADLRLLKLATRAKDAIQLAIGAELDAIAEKRTQIGKALLDCLQGEELPQDVLEKQYWDTLQKDPEMVILNEEEAKLWDREIDFEHSAVVAAIDDVREFPETSKVVFREMNYEIDPHRALHFLIEDGYIEIATETAEA